MDMESPDEDTFGVSPENNSVDDISENHDIVDEYIREEDTPESRLLSCAKAGKTAEMKALLASSAVDVNAISESESASQGLSALHLAVRHKHLKCVKLLLANGADVNKMDNFGFRPIHDACLLGNSEALILLLKHGATTDGIEKKGLHHITPVLYAAKQGHVNCLRLLSSKKPLDDAVLWDASSKRGSWQILEHLSSKELKQEMLPSLLQNSALAGHSAFLRAFLRSCNFQLSDESARLALFTAAQHGHIQYIAVLLEYGVDPNIRGEKNTTALHNAARFGQLQCIRELVQGGANIEALTDQRWTPLHIAVRQCQEEATTLLIELGSNVDAKGGPMEETPLHLAASIGDVLVLQSLLDKSPNLLVTNQAGKSVLQSDIKPSIKEIILKHAKR